MKTVNNTFHVLLLSACRMIEEMNKSEFWNILFTLDSLAKAPTFFWHPHGNFSNFIKENFIDRKFLNLPCSEKTIPEKTTMQTTTDREPEEPISYKNVVMSIYTPVTKPGPCKFIDGTRKQNHQCRRDTGLPEAVLEAKRLAQTHCEEQFKFDRWNCSIETRGKRNIFKKVRSGNR